eukprot:2100161-Rhodomonas_salina.1
MRCRERERERARVSHAVRRCARRKKRRGASSASSKLSWGVPRTTARVPPPTRNSTAKTSRYPVPLTPRLMRQCLPLTRPCSREGAVGSSVPEHHRDL